MPGRSSFRARPCEFGEGQATRKIATEMNLSLKTVQAYCARIKDKLGLANGSELVREAVRWVQTSHAV